MDLKTLIVAALLSAGLAGCHGSPSEIGSRTGEALAATPDNELVSAYAYSKATFGINKAKIRGELERRAVFTPDQWSKIDRGVAGIGDTEMLVFAAWGPPEATSDLLTEKGRSRILTYELKGRRVYVDNGIVTAIGSGR